MANKRIQNNDFILTEEGWVRRSDDTQRPISGIDWDFLSWLQKMRKQVHRDKIRRDKARRKSR